MAQEQHQNQIAYNKKARHLYELSDSFEAGIALTGPEVKSLRAGQVNFKDSYVDIRDGKATLIGLHIAPYANAGYVEQSPDRSRVLLLHAREIHRITTMIEQKGYTVVPTRLYFRHGKVKLEIALARGKKLYDQRDDLKQRAMDRDMERELSGK